MTGLRELAQGAKTIFIAGHLDRMAIVSAQPWHLTDI